MGESRSFWVLIIATLLLSVVLLFCSEVHAQVTVEFKLMPPGELGVVNGEKFRIYTLGEWLELAEFDAELVKLQADVEDHKDIVEKLEKQIVEKDKGISTLKRDKQILAGRCLRLDGDLNKCEEENIEMATDAVWGYVVGGAGAFIGIVGITWAIIEMSQTD